MKKRKAKRMEKIDAKKQPKTYSLDPAIMAWVTQKAARQTIEEGERVSESQVVNNILEKAMKKENNESARS